MKTYNLKKSASKWAWQERIDSKYQLMLKESFNHLAKPLIETDSYHFDLSDSGVIYHTVKSLNADIYQTVAQ